MLEIKNITKKYKPKKGVPVIALNNVSLQFQDKGMVFVLGKSGSGKSTLLNILGGLDQADGGEIIIKGKSSKDFTQSDFDSYRNTYLGFIFQEYNILEEFTVGANIGLAIELQGKKATDEEINRIMEEVDLAGYGTRKPNELSGGQKQRVAIARALVKNPEIIMADEPTGALDSKTGIQVFNTLKKLSKDKLVIIVSHDREFAELYGDRVIEFADGQVISDIEKTFEKPVGKSEGVNVVDDSLIYVKKGYKLTQDDLLLINDYIDKSSEDIIISIDQQTNRNIKKFARIDDEGNKEVFKPTDVTRLSSLDEKNPFKLIKSRLPIKDAVKIGASGLRGKPIRLFLTILLSLISFTLFGLADTMGSYNKVDATVKSIIDSNIKNVTFVKTVVDDPESNYPWYRDVTMFDSDVQLIEEELGIPFHPVYNRERYSGGMSLYNNLLNTNALGNEYEGYYKSSISGFVELSKEELNNLGFSVTGELPNDYDEIAITKYIYDHFKKAGYRNNNYEGTIVEIKAEDMTEDKMIGQTIYLNEGIYTITAIIDTQVDENRYGYLKEDRIDTSIVDYIQIQEFDSVIRHGYHALGIVKPGFIQNNVSENDGFGLQTRGIGEIYLESQGNYGNQVSHIVRLSDLTSDQIHLFDANKTALNKDEVLLDLNTILRYLNLHQIELPEDLKTDDISDYGELLNRKVFEAKETYIRDHYQKAYDNGFDPSYYGITLWDDNFYEIPYENYTEENKYQAYFEFVHSHGYNVNEYGKSGEELEHETRMEERIKIVQDPNFLAAIPVDNYFMHGYIDGYGPIEKNGKGIEPVVAGFFISSENSDEYNQTNYLVVTDELYNQFESNKQGPYSWAIAQMPSSEADIRKVVEFRYDSGIDGVQFEMKNAVSYLLDQVNGFIEDASKVFLYIGIGFAVFSSLLLFNFITASIANKKREIGVLRALGARSSDVFSIFFSESLIIALINFMLALMVTIGGILFINNYLRTEYGLLITFLNFGFRQFVLMLVVSVAVALISSFLPVYRIAHKKPIDAIKNR
jgi:putative ABC transport system permease protein